MAAIQQAVRAVCLLLLLDSLLQMLFPKGGWQQCLRLISGLLLAVLLVQPFSAFRGGEVPLPKPFVQSEAAEQKAQHSGAQLLSALSASAGRQQQQLLAEQAAALARLATGAETVNSWWDGEVLHLQIAAEADAAALRQDIAFLLQLSEEDLEVSVNGGRE